MGDHEGSSVQGAQEVITLARDLTAQLAPHVAEAHFTVGEGHWHDEPAWRERLPAFLRWWRGLEEEETAEALACPASRSGQPV